MFAEFSAKRSKFVETNQICSHAFDVYSMKSKLIFWKCSLHFYYIVVRAREHYNYLN